MTWLTAYLLIFDQQAPLRVQETFLCSCPLSAISSEILTHNRKPPIVAAVVEGQPVGGSLAPLLALVLLALELSVLCVCHVELRVMMLFILRISGIRILFITIQLIMVCLLVCFFACLLTCLLLTCLLAYILISRPAN